MIVVIPMTEENGYENYEECIGCAANGSQVEAEVAINFGTIEEYICNGCVETLKTELNNLGNL